MPIIAERIKRIVVLEIDGSNIEVRHGGPFQPPTLYDLAYLDLIRSAVSEAILRVEATLDDCRKMREARNA